MTDIQAIDPGPVTSAWVGLTLVEGSLQVRFAYPSFDNQELTESLMQSPSRGRLVIERMEGYGMPVGKEVFETVWWSGRLHEAALRSYDAVDRLTRKAVKVHHCGVATAKDGNVILALKDRFGDKGTKSDPGVFYGVSGDAWQAIALGVARMEMPEVP